MKAQSGTAVRATNGFPPELYETLGDIAKQNKVSLAWVAREAAEQYVGEKWPLFKRQGKDGDVVRIFCRWRNGASRSRERLGMPLRER